MCKIRPMSNPRMLDQDRPADPKSPTNNEPDESFGDILSEYEQSHTHRTREEGKRGLEGTVVAITGESVFLDIGYKTEGTIPVAEVVAKFSRPGWDFPSVNMLEVRPDLVRVLGLAFEETRIQALG